MGFSSALISSGNLREQYEWFLIVTNVCPSVYRGLRWCQEVICCPPSPDTCQQHRNQKLLYMPWKWDSDAHIAILSRTYKLCLNFRTNGCCKISRPIILCYIIRLASFLNCVTFFNSFLSSLCYPSMSISKKWEKSSKSLKSSLILQEIVQVSLFIPKA